MYINIVSLLLFVSICVCCYMKISLHELSWQEKIKIKCALSTFRAHFYVISFAKNDFCIISTMFNAVERSLRHGDYQGCFAYLKLGLQLTWIWSTSSAVMISTPDGLFKVIIACCIDQRGRLSIFSWLKSFFVARCRIYECDCRKQSSSTGVPSS